MKRSLKASAVTATIILTVAFFLAGCKTEILTAIPKNGSLSYKEIVYVENDGRCETGQVIKITGGKMSEKISRKYECVQRPD